MERIIASYYDYKTNMQTKWDVISRLEDQRTRVENILDTFWYKAERGIEYDADQYNRLLVKINEINEDLRVLYMEEFDAELADPFMIDDDPFSPEDTEPVIEYEIPAWLDEQMDYAELRRGNA